MPNPPMNRRRALSRLALYTLLHIAISLCLVVVVSTAFAMPLVSGLSPDATFDDIMKMSEALLEENLGPITYIALLGSSIVSVVVYSLFIRRQKQDYAPLTAKRPASLAVLPPAVLATISACVFVGLLLNWVLRFLPEGTETSSLDNLDGPPWAVLLSVVVVAPIAEELCFRMLCLRNANGVFPFRVANVLQALLFGMIHVVPVQVVYAFAFGLLLGWLYDRTGRIIVPIAAHMAFNFIGAIALIFPVEEEAAAAEAATGSELAACIITFGVTVGLLCLVNAMTRKCTLEDGEDFPTELRP